MFQQVAYVNKLASAIGGTESWWQQRRIIIIIVIPFMALRFHGRAGAFFVFPTRRALRPSRIVDVKPTIPFEKKDAAQPVLYLFTPSEARFPIVRFIRPRRTQFVE